MALRIPCPPEDDQIELRNTFAQLAARGVSVLLSNSDTPFIRDLYDGFHVTCVMASRMVNSKAERRGKVPELIVQSHLVPTDTSENGHAVSRHGSKSWSAHTEL